MGLTDRYHALPRAGRWLIWAAIGVALYFPLVEYPLTEWRESADRADALQAQLASFHARSSDGLEAELLLGAAQHGQIDPPADRAAVSDRLDRAIASIFEQRGVGRYNVNSRSAQIARGSLLSQDGRAMERLIREINFETDPATTLAVLADLERHPIIPHAPFVQLQRLEDQGTLRARITVESWALLEPGAGR